MFTLPDPDSYADSETESFGIGCHCFLKKSVHLTLADSYSVLYSGADRYCTQFDTDIGTDEVNFFNVMFIATFASELVPV